MRSNTLPSEILEKKRKMCHREVLHEIMAENFP